MDFNDTKTAFARKSDGEMRNALMLFRMMKRPGLVKAGKRACGRLPGCICRWGGL